jgi:acetyl-CoA synthetase
MRVDDVVIVSGHNLGRLLLRMPSKHPAVAKVLLLVFRMTSKERTYGYVILKESGEIRNKENLFKEINQYISDHVGIAKLDKIQFVSGLPKTRSGKIMRRILRKIAEGDFLTLEIPRHY